MRRSLILLQAENYGDYFFGENWREYRWMEDRPFTYKTEFSRPSLAVGERLFFISGGIDYSFEILFNGSEMLRQEGIYTPVRLDLTGDLKEKNELIIRILPAPKLHPDTPTIGKWRKAKNGSGLPQRFSSAPDRFWHLG